MVSSLEVEQVHPLPFVSLIYSNPRSEYHLKKIPFYLRHGPEETFKEILPQGVDPLLKGVGEVPFCPAPLRVVTPAPLPPLLFFSFSPCPVKKRSNNVQMQHLHYHRSSNLSLQLDQTPDPQHQQKLGNEYNTSRLTLNRLIPLQFEHWDYDPGNSKHQIHFNHIKSIRNNLTHRNQLSKDSSCIIS